MGAAEIEFEGNLTDAPDLRFTPSGAAVVAFNVAVNERKKQNDEWVDAPPSFFRVSAWKTLGENIAESLDKGDRVFVKGKIRQRSWQTDEGEKRTVYEVTADVVAPVLRYATVQVTKNERNNRSLSSREVAQSVDDDERPF